MKAIKKLLSAVLALTLIGTSLVSGIALPVSAEEIFTEGYYTYEIKNGGAIITDVDAAISGDVVIPDTLGGYSVVEIGVDAFFYCESLTSITIPDGVTKIGDFAFYNCKSLESITIPSSVTSIGWWAFRNSGLSAVYITDIAAWCNIDIEFASLIFESNNPIANGGKLYLNGTLVEDLVIPDGVTSINNDAFFRCYQLKSVTIPDSVTNIGDFAFAFCDFESITIPDSVTDIGRGAFYACDGLKNVNIGKNVSEINEYTFYSCDNLSSVVIPDSVSRIGYEGFMNCENLTYVHLGTGVASIERDAFLNCIRLRSITIPENVTEIERSIGYYEEDNYSTEEIFNIYEAIASQRNAYGTLMGNVTAFGGGYEGDYAKIPDFTIYGYSGTAAEKYANDNGFIFVDLSAEQGFETDEDTMTVSGIIAGITAGDLTVEIKDKNGNTLASDALIGTGCTITKDGKEYTVIVSGDSSGDGLVNSTDFMQVRRQYLGLFSMNTAQSLAADVTGDDNINSTDFTRIRRHFLGLYDLYA